MSADPTAAARAIANSCLALRARRLARLLTRLYDEALRPHGLTTAQCNILVAVTLMGPSRPADVAAQLDLEKSTLSRNVARMIDSGWLAAADHDDARSHLLQVTAAGQRLLTRIQSAWKDAQDLARKQLGAEAVRALDSMAEAMREA